MCGCVCGGGGPVDYRVHRALVKIDNIIVCEPRD